MRSSETCSLRNMGPRDGPKPLQAPGYIDIFSDLDMPGFAELSSALATIARLWSRTHEWD
jgi:hypothetical protein